MTQESFYKLKVEHRMIVRVNEVLNRTVVVVVVVVDSDRGFDNQCGSHLQS